MLKVWGVGKNANSEKWGYVDRTIKKRKLQGKESDVLFYGQHQSHSKVMKEIARNVTFSNTLQGLADAPTPSGVSVVTPAVQDLVASPGPICQQIIPSLESSRGYFQVGKSCYCVADKITCIVLKFISPGCLV